MTGTWQQYEAAGHVAAESKQKVTNSGAHLAFSFSCSPLIHEIALPTVRAFSPHFNFSGNIQANPEVCLLGDSKASQVDNKDVAHHTSHWHWKSVIHSKRHCSAAHVRLWTDFQVCIWYVVLSRAFCHRSLCALPVPSSFSLGLIDLSFISVLRIF